MSYLRHGSRLRVYSHIDHAAAIVAHEHSDNVEHIPCRRL